MAAPSPSRRDLMEILSAILGSAAFVPIAGCSSSNNKAAKGTPSSPDGTTDDTDDTDETDPLGPAPQFDAAAVSDALGLALAAVPIEVDVDTLLTGAQAEIEALHEAGLTETAAWTTTAIDELFTQTLGAFGAALPENGPLDSDQSKMVADELVTSLTAACTNLSGGLAAVTEELRTTAGTDTVAPVDEVVSAFGEHEVSLRKWMHTQSAGEGNLSGQTVANHAIHDFQKARIRASTNQSLTQVSDGLGAALDVLATAATTAAAGRSARRFKVPTHPYWRSRMTSPPPPDDITDFCDTFSAITFLIDMTLGLKGIIQVADTATTAATQRFVDFLDEVEDYGEEAQYLLSRYWSWVAADVGEEVVGQVQGQIESRVQGAIESELSEQECDFLAAMLLTCFFILSVVAWFIAFIEAITWVAGLLGATPTGGMIALLIIVLLVVIIYFVLQMVCSVVSLLTTLETMFTDCTP